LMCYFSGRGAEVWTGQLACSQTEMQAAAQNCIRGCKD
jgi:hypothetical protein